MKREKAERKNKKGGVKQWRKKGQRCRPLRSGQGWDAETDKEEGAKMIEGEGRGEGMCRHVD